MATVAESEVPRWEPATKVADNEARVAGAGLRSVACSADFVATASSRPVVKVWQVAEAGVSELLKISFSEGAGMSRAVGSSCVEISPVGGPDEQRLLAVCYDDGGIGLWDLRSGGPAGEFSASVPQALKARFLCGGQEMVSGGPSGSLCFWDRRKTGERPVAEYGAARSTLTDSKDKNDLEPGVKRHKAEVKGDVKADLALGGADEVRAVSSPIYSLAVSRDGTMLSCGRASGTVSVMRLDSHEWARDVQAHWHPGGAKTAAVRALGFDSESRVMLSGGDDGHVCMLDAAGWAMRRKSRDKQRGAQPERFSGHRGWITSISLCPDTTRTVCVTTSWDRTVKLWDFATHKALHTYTDQHTESVFDSAFSSDGRYFVTVGADAGLCLYTAAHQVGGGLAHKNEKKEDMITTKDGLTTI